GAGGFTADGFRVRAGAAPASSQLRRSAHWTGPGVPVSSRSLPAHAASAAATASPAPGRGAAVQTGRGAPRLDGAKPILSFLAYSFLLQPTVLIVTALGGILIALGSRKKLGLGIAFLSLVCLYGFATPYVSSRLLQYLEAQVPDTTRNLDDAQAIVVLSGTIHHGDNDKVPDELGLLTLERVARAAEIERAHPLP